MPDARNIHVVLFRSCSGWPCLSWYAVGIFADFFQCESYPLERKDSYHWRRIDVCSTFLHCSLEEERPEISQLPISIHMQSAPAWLQGRHENGCHGLGANILKSVPWEICHLLKAIEVLYTMMNTEAFFQHLGRRQKKKKLLGIISLEMGEPDADRIKPFLNMKRFLSGEDMSQNWLVVASP